MVSARLVFAASNSLRASVATMPSAASARPQLADRDEIGTRADKHVRLPVLNLAQILARTITPDDPVAGFPSRPGRDRDRRRCRELAPALRCLARGAAGKSSAS